MALVNPNIAMSYRAPDIQPQNMLADYAAIQQIQSGKQAQQLNALKMQEYQRGVEEQNQLRALDPASADYLAQVSRINPKTGFEFGKLQRESETAKLTQQSTKADIAKKMRDWENSAKRDLSLNPSPENIKAFAQDAVIHGFATPEQAEAKAAQYLNMPPDQLIRMLSGAGATAGELKPTLTPQNLGGTVQIMATPAFGGPATVVPGSVGNVTMTPGQAQANQIAEARLAQGDRRIGLMEDKLAAGPKPAALKMIPVHAQKAILGAVTSTKKIDDAIAALEASPESTGLKGYLPNVALSRLYPEGTDARAAIADVGSLLIHDRSGAAVTASETPRLLPFVPQITDNKAEALKKLKRLRQIQVDEAEALAGTYTPEQGFNEFKPGAITPGTPAPAAPGALSPAEQAELEQLRKRFKK